MLKLEGGKESVDAVGDREGCVVEEAAVAEEDTRALNVEGGSFSGGERELAVAEQTGRLG